MPPSAASVEKELRHASVPQVSASTPRHAIGVVETRTGLSAHTIRAWEKRYGAVEPDRSEGGHRLYSDEEIRRLRLLHELTERGHRISHVADLDTDEIEALLEETVADERRTGTADAGAPAGPLPMSGSSAELRDELFEAILSYDGDRLEAAFRRAAMELSARELIEEVIAPLLQRVGDAWEEGEVSPGQEHLLSAVVVRTLGWILDSYRPSPDAPKAVVATPTGQRHNLGALLAAATVASSGWQSVYLGGDLPGDEIAEAARRTGARVVALSLVWPESEPEVEDEIRALAGGMPEETALLVGGSSAGSYAGVLEEVGATLLSGYDQLRSTLAGLRS